jgi:hypothetical protein
MPIHRQQKLTTADSTDSSGEQPAPGLPDQQTFWQYLRELARDGGGCDVRGARGRQPPARCACGVSGSFDLLAHKRWTLTLHPFSRRSAGHRRVVRPVADAHHVPQGYQPMPVGGEVPATREGY